MRNKFIAMVSAVLLVACSSESQSGAQSNLVTQPSADKPNFLIIVADDMKFIILYGQ